MREYVTPQYYKPAGATSYQPIVTTLSPVAGRSGHWQSGANSWTATFGSAGAGDGMESFADNGITFGFAPLHVADPAALPTVAGSTASYAQVWPGTDLVEQVTTTGVKEDLVLDATTAATSYQFALSGLTAVVNSSGGLDLRQGPKVVATVPAPTASLGGHVDGVDAKGAQAKYAVSGNVVTVSVSSGWFGALPKAAFPVTIDPWVELWQSPSGGQSFSSLGSAASNLVVGNNAQGAWASTLSIPLTPPSPKNSEPWGLEEANIEITCSVCTGSNLEIFNEPAQPTSYASVRSGIPLHVRDNGTDRGQNGLGADLSRDSAWVAGGSAWFGFDVTGTNAYTQIPDANIVLDISWVEQPNPTSVSSPANGAIISSPTPTLTATPTDTANMCPNGYWAQGEICDAYLYYDFQVSTSPTPSARSVVADSGWITWPSTINSTTGVVTLGNPTWTVPAGALADGATYYATVSQTVQLDPNPADYPGNPGVNVDGSPAGYLYAQPSVGPATSFQVKQRLSAGGPSPTDTIGAAPGSTSTPSVGAPSPGTSPSSETVDLVTGNLSLTETTPQMQTLAGPAGVSLTYNSALSSVSSGQAATGSAAYGLWGQYYNDSGSHTFPATPAVEQQVNPTVDLAASAMAGPVGALAPLSAYMVRWTGQLSLPPASAVPTGTTFQIGGAATGGMRVYLNGSSTPTYDDWAGTAASSGQSAFGSTALSPGATGAIEVDDWSVAGGPSSATLQVEELVPGQSPVALVVPSTWLIARPTGLPPGWSLSQYAAAAWTSLSDLGTQVVLHSPTGATATFTRNTNGGYQAPPGDTDLLTLNSGSLELQTSAGQVYVFNADGLLASMTTVTNQLTPDALTYTYAPTSSPGAGPTALQSITDPVSARSINLSYGGQSACPSANAAPAGMLCHIAFWDGTATDLYYNSNGQLAEVLNPGNNISLFAYDSDNKIVDVRDALANDYIAANEPGISSCTPSSAPTSCQFDTTIGYTTSCGPQTTSGGECVGYIVQPAPADGVSRQARFYSYAGSWMYPGGGGTTTVNVTGFSQPVDRVVYNANGLISGEYPARTVSSNAGISGSHTVWDSLERPIIGIDNSGEQTSTVYGSGNNVTDVYGPAPTSCFDSSTWPSGVAFPQTNPLSGDRSGNAAAAVGYLPVANPTATCGASVPHAQKRYDEGITGLAATYWPDGQYAGPPTLYGTGNGIGNAAGAACTGDTGSSSTALCASWPAGSAPGGTDANGLWSMRLTGNISVNTVSNYTFVGTDTQPLTLSIDGALVGTNVSYSAPGVVSGVAPTFTASTSLTAGTHTIEVDVQGSTGQATAYSIGSEPTTSGPLATIPLSRLDPAYSLPTTVVDPDGDTTTTGYASSAIGAQYRLAQSTTVGAGTSSALTTASTYETPGTGYLRVLSKKLPAGNATTFQYYGGTQTLAAATCGVSTSVPQGGHLESQIDPAPNYSTIGTREMQFVYDAEGRLAGSRVGTSTTISAAPWSCTAYDARGRILTQSWPATGTASARTVTYGYAIGGNPLVSNVSDTAAPGGAITSTVDLLGRMASYTDAWGQTSTANYNSAAQLISTTGPNGNLTNTYDPNSGSLSSIANGSATLATLGYSTTTNKLASVAYGSGITGQIAYDANGRESGLTFAGTAAPNAVIAADQATYSAGGRMVTDLQGTASNPNPVNPNPAGQSAPDYTYDPAGRLVSAYYPGSHTMYGYGTNPAGDNCATPGAGANDDRTNVTVTPTSGAASSTDFCYDGADQLVSTITAPGTSGATTSTDYSYDGQGNQTEDNGAQLTYDASGRLSSTSSSSGVVTTYSYDALNRVVARTTGTARVTFYYNGLSDDPAATGNGTSITTRLVNLPGGVLLTQQSPDVWSYPDLHGDFTTTSTDGGTATPAASYDAWGKSTGTGSVNNAGGSSDLGAFGVDGKVTDTATDYIIMGARAYNPAEARFTSVDPINGGCANAYTYSFGDPVNSNDLSGQGGCGGGGLGISPISGSTWSSCDAGWSGATCTLTLDPTASASVVKLLGSMPGTVGSAAAASLICGLIGGGIIGGVICGGLEALLQYDYTAQFQKAVDQNMNLNLTFGVSFWGSKKLGWYYTPLGVCGS